MTLGFARCYATLRAAALRAIETPRFLAIASRQSVYVVGDAKELGGWDPNAAIKLSPTSYPSWSGTVTLPRGANVHFKFIKKSGGSVVWEGGADHTLSVPAAATGAFASTWQ